MFKFALIYIYLFNGHPTIVTYGEYAGFQKCQREIPDAVAEWYSTYGEGYPLLQTECVPLS